MAWIPRYIVSGGMYGGRTCPAGSLTGLIGICQNHYTVSDCAFGFGSMGDDDPDYTNWQGSYGMNDSLLREYILNHMDGDSHEFLLAELDIKNPQGAQYYKQSLGIYATITAFEAVEPATDPGQSDLHVCNYSIAISKIVRREYPTPYSPYTETGFSPTFSISGGNFYISGTVELGSYWTTITKSIYIALGDFTYENNDYFGIGIYNTWERADHYNSGWGAGIIGVDYDTLDAAFHVEFEPDETDDPNEDPGEEGNDEDGGDGEHNRPVDDIDVPPLPDLGAVDAGFITIYHLSAAEMWNFAQHFFASTILDIIRLYFNNPMDIFVSGGILPFTPPGNSMWYPQIGGAYISSQALEKVDQQFVEIDCGSVYIEPYGKNCFDYSPYTKIGIFLPYIGYREIDVDEIMGQSIHVIYHCDVLSGDCVAFIYTTIPRKGLNVPARVVIDQYVGNCLTQIPVGSVSFDQMVRGLIDLTATGIDAGLKSVGNVSGLSGEVGGLSSMESLTASTAAIVAGAKPTTRNGGAIGNTSGYMSIQKPYIIRHIPNQSLPDRYKDFFGYPCNRSGTLGDSNFTGFAIVEDIQLNNVPAMEDERAEIMDWLRKGVLL